MHRVTETYSLSPKQAADFLGVHEATVKRWAKAGTLPAFQTPGKWWRFSQAELEAWVAANRRGDAA